MAVDLVALLPGGGNGGAKLFALDLLHAMAQYWDITCFCLLNMEAEITSLIGDKVRVIGLHKSADLANAYAEQAAQMGPFAINFFPMQRVSLQGQGGVNVSVVHDLQFLDLPENFTTAQKAERTAAFHTCVEHSDLIITVSEFTRRRVEEVADISGDRIRVIYNALKISEATGFRGTSPPPNSYFVYPANFWPHKNHKRLLEAYRLYRETQSQPLDLVLTGEPSVAPSELIDSIQAQRGVSVTGFLDRAELQAMLEGATALLFPSLYEGFGMPLTEAMAAGVPIACSSAGSLPEIAGRAALLFDGNSSIAIAAAMTKISSDMQLRATLTAEGRNRLLEIGNFQDMHKSYHNAFNSLLARPVTKSIGVEGLDNGGWAVPTVAIELPAANHKMQLKLQMALPEWAPISRQLVEIASYSRVIRRVTLWPGLNTPVTLRLLPDEHSILLRASEQFQLRSVIDTASQKEVSYQISAAALVDDGRQSCVWSPGALSSAAPSTVALLAITGLPEDGYSVHAVAISATPVATSLVPQVSGESVTFDARFEPLSSTQTKTLVTQIKLPSAPSLPEFKFASGIIPITFRAINPSPPAIIPPNQTEAGFSVIIPSFNQGQFLARTIDSVLCQDHVLEVLVLDGGSTDSTLDVLSSYGSRINWWSGPDGGQAEAVNRGLTRARGEYIAWINSDDTYEPGAFSHVARIFADQQMSGVIYGDADHIDEVDQYIDTYPTADFKAAALRDRCFICQPSAFFRRQAAVEHGGLRGSLRYCLDYEFWLRLAASGVIFKRTRKLLAHSRMYANNKTLGERLHAYFETADLMIRTMAYGSGKWKEHFVNAAADHIAAHHKVPRAFAIREARQLANSVWPAFPK